MSKLITITLPERCKFIQKNWYRDCNLFIEAGAGAGKTNSIVGKIIDQLIEGIPPKKFVIITFTNKATEEMRARIDSDINKEKKNIDKYTPDQIKILEKAAKELYQMNISTIHSFCNNILNKYSFDAKISYGAELLEDEDEQKRKDKIFIEWKKTLNNESITELNNINEIIGLGNVHQLIKNSYDCLCDEFDDANIIYDTNINYLDCVNVIENSYQIMQEGINYINSALDTYQFISNYDISSLKNENIENIILVKEILSRLKKIPKNTCFIKSIFKEKFASYKGEIEKALNKISNYHFKTVNKYAMSAWEYYKNNMTQETLTNNQLIYKCYELIKNNKNIAQKIAEDIDVIYIDEFQDTDEYQIKFLYTLGLAINDRKKKNKEPMTMSMFIVGDPKQSIYRFRGADINSYNSVKEDWENNGENFKTIFLPDNFRSNQLIVNYVNDEYKSRNLGDGCSYECMTVPNLHEIHNFDKNPKIIGGVYSYPFLTTDKLDNKFVRLINLIKFLKEQKYKIYAKKEGSNEFELREIKYSDFLILTCSKKEIGAYAETFAKAGIASNVQGQYSLGSSEILRINYRILSYLLNPNSDNQNIAYSILESFSIKPEEYLKKIKENTKGFSAYGKFLYVFNNFEIISEDFLDSSEYMYESAKEQLFEKLCLKFNATPSELLYEISEFVENYEESQIILNKNADAVRIMNIHKSKGLEGEIVIIPNSGGFNNDTTLVSAKKDKYLNCINFYEQAKQTSKNEIEQERVRLDYVGVTRARQVLIYDREYKGEKNYKYLGEISNDNFKKYQIEDGVFPSLEMVSSYFTKKENHNVKKINATNNLHLKDEQLKKYYLETSPSRLEIKDETYEIANQKVYRPVGNVFGNCLHRSMELYVLGNKLRSLGEIINQAIHEYSDSIEFKDIDKFKFYLMSCVRSVVSYYDEINLFNNAKKLFPEFKFITSSLINDKEALISGSIDLLIENKDGSLKIIDYKSDIAGFKNINDFEEKLKHTYANELLQYQEVISKLYNVKKDKIEIGIIWLEEKENKEIVHYFTIN